MTATSHSTEPTATTPAAPGGWLAHFPVALFSSVMGLGGVALAWRRAHHVWDMPEWPSHVFLGLAITVFVVVSIVYLAKWVRHPSIAWAELRHPIRMSFAPTFTISLLILAIGTAEHWPDVARVMWWAGALGHLLATVLVLSAWFGRPDITTTQITPAWFIPIVGNVITPIAAPSVGSMELAWFSFGVGVIFWLALLPLIMGRVLAHDAAIPTKLLPTLAIFMAPPAVTMISWQTLNGVADDAVTRVLYASVVIFAVLLAAQVARLHRVPFALPYWAYTFPLAAAAIATTAGAAAFSGVGYDIIAGIMLGLATVIVIVVAALTVRAIVQRRLFVPE